MQTDDLLCGHKTNLPFSCGDTCEVSPKFFRPTENSGDVHHNVIPMSMVETEKSLFRKVVRKTAYATKTAASAVKLWGNLMTVFMSTENTVLWTNMNVLRSSLLRTLLLLKIYGG